MAYLDQTMVKILAKRLTSASKAAPSKSAVDYFQKRKEEITKLYGPEREISKDRFPPKDELFSGLLDDALWQEEQTAGFFRATDYLKTGLTAQAFLDNLRLKRPFKDYGANAEHGEFTHRIQWYAVSKNVFGSTPSADVFASLADWYDPNLSAKAGGLGCHP
jgi:hypothetical protein